MTIFLNIQIEGAPEDDNCGHQPCPYRIQLDPTVGPGMTWLANTLRKIVSKEDHKNRALAAGAAEGLYALTRWIDDAHEKLHVKDGEIAELKQKVSDLTNWVESLKIIVEAEGAAGE
jgi:hypothetical protein